MRKLTKAQIEQAKFRVNRTNTSFDVQLSPRIYATFGISGMSITKCDGTKSGKRKLVNNWRAKTAAEINEELGRQAWIEES